MSSNKIKSHKEIIAYLIDNLNSRNIDNLSSILSNDVELEMFSIINAKLYTILGIRDTLLAFREGMNVSDLIIIIDLIICEGDLASVKMLFQGSNWKFRGGFEINTPFEYDCVYFISFEQGKIKTLKQIQDSFKLLQYVGRAILKSDDRKVINDYIATLNNAGIYSDNIKSSV